jgi:hypothetical protein
MFHPTPIKSVFFVEKKTKAYFQQVSWKSEKIIKRLSYKSVSFTRNINVLTYFNGNKLIPFKVK